jgi:hypothetical protein
MSTLKFLGDLTYTQPHTVHGNLADLCHLATFITVPNFNLVFKFYFLGQNHSCQIPLGEEESVLCQMFSQLVLEGVSWLCL